MKIFKDFFIIGSLYLILARTKGVHSLDKLPIVINMFNQAFCQCVQFIPTIKPLIAILNHIIDV